MSYSPDYLSACRQVSRAHDLSEWHSGLLRAVGASLAAGRLTAQVPEIDVARETRAGRLDDPSIHDAGEVGRLVEDGYLAWRTRKGWSHEPDGRNPLTGKPQPSRTLWMGERVVEELGPALHDLYLLGMEAVRRKAESGPELLRAAYRARYEEGVALGRERFLATLSGEAAPSPEAAPGMAP